MVGTKASPLPLAQPELIPDPKHNRQFDYPSWLPRGNTRGILLRQALYHWYGMTSVSQTYTTPAEFQTTRIPMETVCKGMSHHLEDLHEIDDIQQTMMHDLFAILDKFDQGQQHLSYLKKLVDFVPDTSLGQWPIHLAAESITIQVATDERRLDWYLIQPRHASQDDAPWILAVNDPRAVNLLLRLRLSIDMENMLELLDGFGFRIKTLRAYPRPSQTLWPVMDPPMYVPGVPLGLGMRVKDTGFTRSDYLHYVDQRNDFLRAYRGRAALLRGGIIWRIARMVLSWDSVVDGPSQYHTRNNYTALLGTGYVDDTLHAHDVNILCGVYRVIPSKSNDLIYVPH